MQKPRITKIFLDMDGVIADFYKRYFELYRLSPRDAEKKKEFNKYFDAFISTKEFARLDLMPGALEGIKFLEMLDIPTEILSSTANEERYEAISEQKLDWLNNYGIKFPVNLVPGKKHKWKFATESSIIIDDTPSVIDDWTRAGGIGILHKNWPETLAILKIYI